MWILIIYILIVVAVYSITSSARATSDNSDSIIAAARAISEHSSSRILVFC